MLNRTAKAFTLLELIVVIVILGILAAIAIPTFQKVINKAKKENVERAAEALDREARALAAFDQVTQAKDATVGAVTTRGVDFYVGASVPGGVTFAAETAAADLGASSGVVVTNTSTTDGTFTVAKDGYTATVTLADRAPASMTVTP